MSPGAPEPHGIIRSVAALSFEFHFGEDLIESDVLDEFQAAVNELSPTLAETMRVLEFEGDSSPAWIDPRGAGALRKAVLAKGTPRGQTYAQLAAESAPAYPRRFGSVLVRGKARSTFLRVSFDECTPAKPMGEKWLWSNTVSGSIGAERIDGTPREQWVQEVATVLGSHPAVVWGAAFDHDEFRFRNLHDGPDGMWALGRDVRRSLPGLYWLNLFGDPYVQLIGRNGLSALDVSSVREVDGNFIVEVYGHPDDWNSKEGRQRHARILRQLGIQFFFDRTNPDKQTKAPDFGLSHLPPRRPFQVVTSDGTHFTPMPRDESPA